MPNLLDSIPSPAVDSVAEVFKPAAELTDTLTVHGVGHVRSLTTYSEMSHGSGHEPEPYVDTPIRSTGTLMMLFTAFLIVAFCYRVGRKYFSTIVENTWSVRRTKNHLDDHTMSETVTMVALIAQALIMEGMIVYCAFFDCSDRKFPKRLTEDKVISADEAIALAAGMNVSVMFTGDAVEGMSDRIAEHNNPAILGSTSTLFS